VIGDSLGVGERLRNPSSPLWNASLRLLRWLVRFFTVRGVEGKDPKEILYRRSEARLGAKAAFIGFEGNADREA